MGNLKKHVTLDVRNNLIEIKFIGSVSDIVYKEIWYDSLFKAKDNGVHIFIINQKYLQKLGLLSRLWFLTQMIPLIKKELNNKLIAFIVPSKNTKHFINLKLIFLVVKLFTNFKFIVVKSKLNALSKLSNI